jgi:hypothetical protein
LSLPWARPIQSSTPHSISPRSSLIIFIHLRLGFLTSLLRTGFPTNNYAFLFSPFVLHGTSASASESSKTTNLFDTSTRYCS